MTRKFVPFLNGSNGEWTGSDDVENNDDRKRRHKEAKTNKYRKNSDASKKGMKFGPFLPKNFKRTEVLPLVPIKNENLVPLVIEGGVVAEHKDCASNTLSYTNIEHKDANDDVDEEKSERNVFGGDNVSVISNLSVSTTTSRRTKVTNDARKKVAVINFTRSVVKRFDWLFWMLVLFAISAIALKIYLQISSYPSKIQYLSYGLVFLSITALMCYASLPLCMRNFMLQRQPTLLDSDDVHTYVTYDILWTKSFFEFMIGTLSDPEACRNYIQPMDQDYLQQWCLENRFDRFRLVEVDEEIFHHLVNHFSGAITSHNLFDNMKSYTGNKPEWVRVRADDKEIVCVVAYQWLSRTRFCTDHMVDINPRRAYRLSYN